MRKASVKNKIKAGKGQGTGATYQAFISASESHSEGTTAEFRDWKTGRIVTCLSQGEKMFYHILRWNDEVVDIQEQYPLDNKLVDAVVAKLSKEDAILLPDELQDNREPYTADFLVTMANGDKRAYQVKRNRMQINTLHDKRRIAIEGTYWNCLHIPFKLIYAEDIDEAYYNNIARAVRYYDESNVFDNVSQFQHLVATKQVQIDMKSGLVDWKKAATEYFRDDEQ